MTRGIVYLVGAGPGDPGLLTLRGRECLGEADVVIYDYLVDARLLRFSRASAETVESGKSGDTACRDAQQESINDRMIAEARAGKIVVRLKGGDPFVFGRGGEECQALADAGIAYEVVPGISSAIAVPAYAGIPVTERGLNSSFSVVTGREAPGTTHPIDWTALAGMETIVLLMALRGLDDVVEKLIAAGKQPHTPAACIQSGTRPTQRTVTASLEELPRTVARAGFEPPAVVVIGEVVRRREALRWFERRPLLGRRIVVTRSAADALVFADRLERLGAEAIVAPAIELGPTTSSEALDGALHEIAGFDWIVFTSAHGVEVFFARLAERGGDVRELHRARLAAIGPGTAGALARRGLRVEVVPSEYRAESLAEALSGRVRGARVLLPRAEGARDVLPAALTRAGAEIVDVASYRARTPDRLCDAVAARLATGGIDAVTFTSSSTVRHFCELLGPDAVARLGGTVVACIGPITADTARSLGLTVAVEAREYTIDGLARALIDYFTPRS